MRRRPASGRLLTSLPASAGSMAGQGPAIGSHTAIAPGMWRRSAYVPWSGNAGTWLYKARRSGTGLAALPASGPIVVTNGKSLLWARGDRWKKVRRRQHYGQRNELYPAGPKPIDESSPASQPSHQGFIY